MVDVVAGRPNFLPRVCRLEVESEDPVNVKFGPLPLPVGAAATKGEGVVQELPPVRPCTAPHLLAATVVQPIVVQHTPNGPPRSTSFKKVAPFDETWG
jgi:hypothetical protein